ncbi:cbb3-type cytochrome c oxidase subunit III [Oleiphilus messinensis]|uniref:Cbb3-type cytochrome c oxidase subunit n=1 Tax=Oleiphilus messinensis TaxID=141451 RepID=A0A1Y0IA68_9GAMM|nr:cytochrome-c oxidase, cbb3-type subunit III [Oleiphilus messinensis]ARU56324.1 cbb3-type cytochrome c oxidase subunit III [Oleiphilus messinensis]
MSEDLSTFWSLWISVIVLGSIFGSWWLLYATRKSQTTDTETEKTMGHTFDGIEELDNPLPKWWFYMFISTIIFALAYCVLYPTLGNFQGILGWSSANQHEREVQEATEKFGPIFAKHSTTPIAELSKNPEAIQIGQRLFANNCSLCHGSTARGSFGFPNLTDNDWLYGGSPDKIKETILVGRNGNMPAKGLKPDMTEAELLDVVNYILSFSDRSDDSASAERGGQMFQQACAACHGPDAKGNQALGAPNLTDGVWLYGGTARQIKYTIEHGRAGVMPAHKDLLGEDKVHILAAYIYSLSNK